MQKPLLLVMFNRTLKPRRKIVALSINPINYISVAKVHQSLYAQMNSDRTSFSGLLSYPEAEHLKLTTFL